jgi:hypothetical protein
MAISILHRRLRFADASNPIERLYGSAFNEALAKTFQNVITPSEESVSSEREIENPLARGNWACRHRVDC